MDDEKYREPLPVTKFKEHVEWMDRHSGFLRHLQMMEDVGEGQPQTEALQPYNEYKNRYINILPYDHSRVKLSAIDGVLGTDYINATFMPGFSSRHEYIASQGPLKGTVDDFWRMVWEQQSYNIVMLTKCYESGWEICHPYWPDIGETRTYGQIKVSLESTDPCSDWSVRNLKMSLDGETHDVRHFHFNSWPDYGVPEREQTMVQFIRVVRENLLPSEGPLIVNCSAGVGRTGTFLVLDHLLQLIKDHNSVSIYTVLADLRQERMWMVQTVDQYKYIHMCLLYVLEGRENVDV